MSKDYFSQSRLNMLVTEFIWNYFSKSVVRTSINEEVDSINDIKDRLTPNFDENEIKEIINVLIKDSSTGIRIKVSLKRNTQYKVAAYSIWTNDKTLNDIGVKSVLDDYGINSATNEYVNKIVDYYKSFK